MAFTSRHARLCVLLIFSSCLIGAASAGTIVSRPGDPLLGTPDYSPTEWALGGGNDQQLAVSWSQMLGSTNTVVSVFGIESEETSSLEATFRLLSGSLDGPEVALATTKTLAAGTLADFPLWTGLTLDPGTYYLTVSATGDGDWLMGDFANQTSDPLAAILSDYFRNSDSAGSWGDPQFFGMGYQVEGDLITNGGGGGDAPEPGTFGLFGAGIVVMGAILRRRARKNA